MANQGWIKLHRKLLDDKIFTSEKGLKVWVWCLLRANHQEAEITLDRQDVCVKEGQFIFGRHSAAEDLNMSSSTVWFWMKKLKSDNYIDINSTNKFSYITINNWSRYQDWLTTDKQDINTDNNDNNEKKKDVISIEEITNIIASLGISNQNLTEITNDTGFLQIKQRAISKALQDNTIKYKAAYITSMYDFWINIENASRED